jgi:hypothetical protein
MMALLGATRGRRSDHPSLDACSACRRVRCSPHPVVQHPCRYRLPADAHGKLRLSKRAGLRCQGPRGHCPVQRQIDRKIARVQGSTPRSESKNSTRRSDAQAGRISEVPEGVDPEESSSGWKPITSSSVATYYNAGGDSMYAGKNEPSAHRRQRQGAEAHANEARRLASRPVVLRRAPPLPLNVTIHRGLQRNGARLFRRLLHPRAKTVEWISTYQHLQAESLRTAREGSVPRSSANRRPHQVTQSPLSV